MLPEARMLKTTTALLAAILALTGCQKKEPLQKVTDVWIRLGAVETAPAAAYFKVYGGATDDKLLQVSSEVNTKTELHESMQSGNMASMKPTGPVDIPAGGKIEFKPGGRHAMLFGMNPAIKPGTPVTLTFTFASGQEIQVDAGTQSASAPIKN
jgi:periplasmic copper chaperone A